MRDYRSRYSAVSKSTPFKLIWILLAVIILIVVVVVFNGHRTVNHGDFEIHRDSRLNDEMKNAISSKNSLSRSGGTSTTSDLSLIRQYVYAMEVINNLSVSMYGESGRLYSDSLFDNVYLAIDDYNAKLVSGHPLNTVFTALDEAITALNVRTDQILN